MLETTTLSPDAPAPAEYRLSPAQVGLALQLFRLPDATGVALPPDQAPQDYAELAEDLDACIARARKIFGELLAPLEAMRNTARAHVQQAIVDAGGRALPHESLEITLERKSERKRDVATLREELAGKIPQADFAQAIFIKSVDVKEANPAVVSSLLENGGKATWEIDLRVLDKLAKDYGGEIAATIAKATEKVEVGNPILTIKRREPAMKYVGGARA